MTTTQLEDLVQQVVDRSTVATITRHVDRITESVVEDLLRDHRAEYVALIHRAISRTLTSLAADSTPGS